MPLDMKLVIEPEDSSLELILATNQYQKFWDEQGRKVISAFQDMTGLEFQQPLIKARVKKGSFANAGNTDAPMTLPGNYSSLEEKANTLIHELAHRLLGGNALSPIALGLVADSNKPDYRFQNFEHRHVYLFLYDVSKEALGKNYAEQCTQHEQQIDEPGYREAWEWTMGMSFKKRQRAIKILTKQALPRERWHERDNKAVQSRDPSVWFASLERQ
jgi:hypothetical protein